MPVTENELPDSFHISSMLPMSAPRYFRPSRRVLSANTAPSRHTNHPTLPPPSRHSNHPTLPPPPRHTNHPTLLPLPHPPTTLPQPAPPTLRSLPRPLSPSQESSSSLTGWPRSERHTSSPIVVGSSRLSPAWQPSVAGSASTLLSRQIEAEQSHRHCTPRSQNDSHYHSPLPPPPHAGLPQRPPHRRPSPADYAPGNIPEDMLANVPPGRGLYNGHECQIAVPGGSAEPSAQAAALARFGDQLRATGVSPAPGIARLPELIPLATPPPQVAGRPTIGVADDTLQPIGMPLVGLCVITGPFGSGRTTAVRCLITTAATARPIYTRYLLVARGSALTDVIEWTEASRNADQADKLASRLAGELEAAAHRPLAPTLTPLIVVENAGDFEGLSAEASIARLLKAARRADVPTIVEADTVTLTSVWQIHAELKTARSGIVLQPEETDGNSLFRVQFPRVTRADFPVGRGLLVENGQIRRVQVALP